MRDEAWADQARSKEADAATGVDARLVERLRAGEDAAFDELVRTTGGRLVAVARRMLGKEEDAQDAVQEAYLSAFKALDKFDGRSQLTTWLHRITVNACLMRLRSQRRRPEKQMDELLPEFIADGYQKNSTKPWKPLGEVGIEAEELRVLVRTKIDELADDYREVLLLRDMEGLDTEATAVHLGISSNAVKTRLHRARQALRTLLEPAFVDG